MVVTCCRSTLAEWRLIASAISRGHTHRAGGVKSTNGLGHATEIYLGVNANICSWSASRRDSQFTK